MPTLSAGCFCLRAGKEATDSPRSNGGSGACLYFLLHRWLNEARAVWALQEVRWGWKTEFSAELSSPAIAMSWDTIGGQEGLHSSVCAETHHKMLHTEINHADTPLPHTLFLPAGFLKKGLLRKCTQHRHTVIPSSSSSNW